MRADRALYRARQFFGSLRPHIDQELRTEAFALLGEGEQRLFASMMTRDQQHSLDVYHRLRTQGHDDRDLLAAALLHDAGKGTIALWHRVAYVVLDAVAPGVLRSAVRESDGPSWREALYRCVHHAELGAQLARTAGSTDRTVALIQGQDSGELQEGLAALQAADDAA